MLTGNEKLEVGGILEHPRAGQLIITSLTPFKIKIYKNKDFGYIENENKDFFFKREDCKNVYTYIPPTKSQEINLQVGDTFKNSNNNLTTITQIAHDVASLKSNTTEWSFSTSKVKSFINSEVYTDYKPVSQQSEEWKPQTGDWVVWVDTVDKTPYKLSMYDSKTKWSVEHKGHNHTYSSNIFKLVRKLLPHEIPTTMKQWKKEDFYNTKIIVDTPEKSRRFQELMLSLDYQWASGSKVSNLNSKYIFMNPNGNMGHTADSGEYFKHHTFKEIFYNEIFNENSNQLNNNNKQNGKQENSNSNDISSTDFSGIRGSQTATACAYRKTSSIASSSGYSGNRINGKSTPTKIGRSEVSFTAISI